LKITNQDDNKIKGFGFANHRFHVADKNKSSTIESFFWDCMAFI
jgi:hypothetical protein